MMTAAQKVINAKMRGLRVTPAKPKGPLTRVPRVGNYIPGQRTTVTPTRRVRREFT